MKLSMLPVLFVLFSCTTGTSTGQRPATPTLPAAFEQAFTKGLSEPGQKVAVFDWDNTMIKHDIGDATFFHMIENGLYKAPASWKATSRHLSAAALIDLNQFCPLSGKAGMLPTKEGEGECGKVMLAVYYDGKTLDGKDAFRPGHDGMKMEPAYAWAVSLLAGYTGDEIRAIAETVVKNNLDAPVLVSKKLHGQTLPGYIRIDPRVSGLVPRLQAAGVDVWVISASQQNVVEAFAQRVGIKPLRVIGVRQQVKDGKLTAAFQECGGVKDIITYREGKRCWANKIIFGVKGAAQLSKKAPLFFGAGDSDTDLEFLKDSRLRLVVNRQKKELMCNALQNADGNWYVVPMFLEPKAPKTDAYDCSAWKIPAQKEI